MKKILSSIALILFTSAAGAAQEIRVSPTSVNAYSQGATTVFLTFSNVVNKQPVDACWCGNLIPAAPDIGFKCDPATVFGCLPVRYDQSRLSRGNTYTDIMSIPPSVARRAYTDAARGAEATFFYVRRFVSLTGGPDEFVPVTIRLSGNGAAVPFSITDVRLSWGVDKPVLLVQSDEKLPAIKAEIKYTGTGRLKGRWELVKPGDVLPTDFDLLTEATLPIEERGRQRRYTEISRFNIFLPPTGRFTLPGPEAWRMPSHVDGLYLVLLRIEAAEDVQGNRGGNGFATGGVAGFSLPALRYYVGGDASGKAPDSVSKPFELASPADNTVLPRAQSADFRWSRLEGAAYYRVEVEDSESNAVLSAVVLSPGYRAPSWLKERLTDGRLRWRAMAFDQKGNLLAETSRRNLQFAN
ncbi:MAG: hypothetical protein L0229_28780 [Blastocatellia bacterium]|nr:hypothetical protein [Blastocatellia bacterium]